MSFVHLHVHSQYSVLDGMSRVPSLVEKCVRLGMPSMALTDHGVMYGIKEFLNYSRRVNSEHGSVVFKPIVGVEAYCARRSRLSKDKDYKRVNGRGVQQVVDMGGWHLILLAKDLGGYRNLCRLVSAGFSDDSFYMRPRIDKELLERYHEGLICCSACLAGEIPQKILLDDIAGAEESISWFKSIFGDDYYLEIQRHPTDKEGGDREVYAMQQRVNPLLLELGARHGVKVVCSNDAHFVNEEDGAAHDRLICVSTNNYIDDTARMHYTQQEWLKSPAEMAALFEDVPEVLANTLEVAEKVEIYDIDSPPLMPLYDIPQEFGTESGYHARFSEADLRDEFCRDEHFSLLDETASAERVARLGGIEKLYRIKLEADYLEHLTFAGARERYGSTLSPEQTERIKFELHTIKTMGFPGYFLIVMDYIRAAREELEMYVGPGRGSAAGSVVAYCLKITDLDPLEYDLLFERFLNPERISLPDIDTDFEDTSRVFEWVSNKYGVGHVAHIITYGAMATKSALSDVGRVERVPLSDVNALKKLIPFSWPDEAMYRDAKGKELPVTLANCYKFIDDFKKILQGDDARKRDMLVYASQLEGTMRQVGVHASGVIIGSDDLTNLVPLCTVEDRNTKKRILLTQYDGSQVESIGLIKMDFLGLATLSVLRSCVQMVFQTHGEKIDINAISKEDANVFKLFQEGRTTGIFQFESPGMRRYMQQLHPTVFGDLIAMNALYRPGPMEKIPSFIRRKHGKESIDYDIPVMEKYLKDTYGITVYQEQVMLLSRLLSNFTRGQADTLRKAMGKKNKELLAKLQTKFLEGGKANGYDEATLNKIWKEWEAFAQYAFNKSHSACYAWVAYQTAYLKTYYPAEFMASCMSVYKTDIKEITKYMQDCQDSNIPVLGPHINASWQDFMVNNEGVILFGLSGIKGVGEKAVQNIIEERDARGAYKDIFDFVERVNLNACNKKTLEALTLSGAFDGLGATREELMAPVGNETMLDILIRYGNNTQAQKKDAQTSLFAMLQDDTANNIHRPPLPKNPPTIPNIEKLNREKELIGVYLSAHPLDEYIFIAKELCELTADDLTYFNTWRNKLDRQNTEEVDMRYDKEEWFQQHGNRPQHFAGLITKALKKISKNDKPYGEYTLEDYSGKYDFNLYGEKYAAFSPQLFTNAFVYVSATLQPRYKEQKWFEEKPFEQTDFEMILNSIEPLQNIATQIQSLALCLPLERLNDELSDEICRHVKQSLDESKTHLPLRIKVFDKEHNTVQLLGEGKCVGLSKNLYYWLVKQRITFKILLQH